MSGRPRLPLGTWGNITVKEVSPGLYQALARVRDLDGVTRRVARRGATPTKATAALRGALKDRTAPGRGDLTERSTLSQAVEQWLNEREHRGDLRAGTVRVYRSVWRTAASHIGGMTLGETTTRTLTVGLAPMERVPTQLRQAHIILRGALGHAVRMGAISTNPARELLSPPRSRRNPRALTDNEVQKLMELARNHRRLINEQTGARWPGPRPTMLLPDVLELLLGTGLRIGEALALRHEDVNLQATPPTVSVTGTLVENKGVHRQPLPKTDAAYRTVAVPSQVAELLARRLAEGRDGNTVFATRSGKWVTPSNVRRLLRAALEGTDLSWVTPHNTRKTVATRIEALHGVRASSHQLGHAKPSTTEDWYLQRSRVHDYADALEAVTPSGEATDATPTQTEHG